MHSVTCHLVHASSIICIAVHVNSCMWYFFRVPPKNEIAESVVALRGHLGMSQQAFATHMNLAIRTIAHYEAERSPQGLVLFRFHRLAARAGRLDLATVFWDAALAELGDVGLENIAAMWSKAETARVAHAAGSAVDFPGVLAEIQGLCLEINPGLGDKEEVKKATLG